MSRVISFVINFEDYANCPDDLKKYINTNGREPINGVYTTTIAEGDESAKLGKVRDYLYNLVDGYDLGEFDADGLIEDLRKLTDRI